MVNQLSRQVTTTPSAGPIRGGTGESTGLGGGVPEVVGDRGPDRR